MAAGGIQDGEVEVTDDQGIVERQEGAIDKGETHPGAQHVGPDVEIRPRESKLKKILEKGCRLVGARMFLVAYYVAVQFPLYAENLAFHAHTKYGGWNLDHRDHR